MREREDEGEFSQLGVSAEVERERSVRLRIEKEWRRKWMREEEKEWK